MFHQHPSYAPIRRPVRRKNTKPSKSLFISFLEIAGEMAALLVAETLTEGLLTPLFGSVFAHVAVQFGEFAFFEEPVLADYINYRKSKHNKGNFSNTINLVTSTILNIGTFGIPLLQEMSHTLLFTNKQLTNFVGTNTYQLVNDNLDNVVNNIISKQEQLTDTAAINQYISNVQENLGLSVRFPAARDHLLEIERALTNQKSIDYVESIFKYNTGVKPDPFDVPEGLNRQSGVTGTHLFDKRYNTYLNTNQFIRDNKKTLAHRIAKLDNILIKLQPSYYLRVILRKGTSKIFRKIGISSRATVIFNKIDKFFVNTGRKYGGFGEKIYSDSEDSSYALRKGFFRNSLIRRDNFIPVSSTVIEGVSIRPIGSTSKIFKDVDEIYNFLESGSDKAVNWIIYFKRYPTKPKTPRGLKNLGGKRPVFQKNVNVESIVLPFLASQSKMEYYIKHIAYGKFVGEYIRGVPILERSNIGQVLNELKWIVLDTQSVADDTTKFVQNLKGHSFSYSTARAFGFDGRTGTGTVIAKLAAYSIIRGLPLRGTRFANTIRYFASPITTLITPRYAKRAFFAKFRTRSKYYFARKKSIRTL